jgi:hypothetical protein
MADRGIIGNPFDWQKYGTGKAVELFFDWVVNGDSHGEELATESFRDAIINRIKNTTTPNILYYKELGYHSHATAIGYIIEHKNELFAELEPQQQPSPAQPQFYHGQV